MQIIPLGTVPFGTVFENGTKRNRPQWYRLEFLEGAGKLVGAAGAAAVALDALQTGYCIGYFHAGNKGGYALGVSITAGGVFDPANGIAHGFYVNALGAYKSAGLEDGVTDAGLGYIGYQSYVKHIHQNFTAKIVKGTFALSLKNKYDLTNGYENTY